MFWVSLVHRPNQCLAHLLRMHFEVFRMCIVPIRLLDDDSSFKRADTRFEIRRL